MGPIMKTKLPAMSEQQIQEIARQHEAEQRQRLRDEFAMAFVPVLFPNVQRDHFDVYRHVEPKGSCLTKERAELLWRVVDEVLAQREKAHE